MFFTKLGTIVAWMAFVLGVFRAATGFVVASNLDTAGFDAARNIGSSTSGRATDQGLMMIAFAIGLGILAEISRRVGQ